MKEIKREEYLEELLARRQNGLIKIIAGIRRCGKSYLLDPIFAKALMKDGVPSDHIIKIALDDIKNEHLLTAQALYQHIMSLIKDKKPYYILLDEVQEVEDFTKVLNSLLRVPNLDIYATGSNSKFLSSDIATEFRGRGDVIQLYPLSFSEFMSAFDGDVMAGWQDYYTYGGLPLVLNQKGDSAKMKYLEEQCQNIYLNDIVERYSIKNDSELRTLVEIIASGVGSLTNPTKITNSFRNYQGDLSYNTVDGYIKKLEESFLIEKSNRYDVRGRKLIGGPCKYYFTDLGLRNSFLSFRQQEESHIMENIIYLELRRRGYRVDVGTVDVREQGKRKQLEIDFVANSGNQRIYIQSALTLPTEKKEAQEERPFLHTGDSFRKLIITRDPIKAKVNESGIMTMNIFDFLLNPDSLSVI